MKRGIHIYLYEPVFIPFGHTYIYIYMQKWDTQSSGRFIFQFFESPVFFKTFGHLYALYGLIMLCCAVLNHSVMSDSLQSRGLQPASLLHPWEFSRQACWSGLPYPPPGDPPNPGIKPRFPALQVDSLLFEPPGKPNYDVSINTQEINK